LNTGFLEPHNSGKEIRGVQSTCNTRNSCSVCRQQGKFFLSEGGSADYIITGAWSAKAAKEVKNVL